MFYMNCAMAQDGINNGGNRLLTILMYLSEPEAGGETVSAHSGERAKHRTSNSYACSLHVRPSGVPGSPSQNRGAVSKLRGFGC